MSKKLDLNGVAQYLDDAEESATAVRQKDVPLDLATAYAVQHERVAIKVGREEKVVGVKLGFTSEAKMAQMGVSEIIVGQLTDRMKVASGHTVHLSQLIHPRVEPEVAFLVGPDPSARTVDSVVAVAPALEIIDSRFEDFRFTLEDVVADNTSAARFAVGEWTPLKNLEHLRGLSVALTQDETVVAQGSTTAILGDPIEALRRLDELRAKYRLDLPAGGIILAGAATEAVPFTSRRYEVSVEGLGTVAVVGGANR